MALLDDILAGGADPSALGWLYGAAMPPQDDAATLAARMRQQSPTVPPPEGWPTASGDSSFGSLSPDTINDATWQNPHVNFPQSSPASTTAPALSFADRWQGAPPPLPPPVNVPAMPAGGMSNDPRAAMAAAPPAGPGLAPPAPVAAQQPPAAQPTSLLGRIGSGINNNSNLLLALGAGLAGAPSIGTGIQRALTAAQPVAQQNQTVQALMARGMPQDMAQLAASNPQALNTILPRLLGAKQWQLADRTNMFNEKVPFLYDPVSGETKELSVGTPSQRAGLSGETVTQTLGNFDSSKVDPNLKGDDYVKQWPQEVQAAAKAYMSGDAMPTGNERSNKISAIGRMVAQKYAMDVGRPDLANDALYPQRRQMYVDLGKTTSPIAIGGQITFGGTSYEHLANLADRLADLNNVNGLGVAPIANLANMWRNLGTNQANLVNNANGEAQHYGQEISKFYGAGQSGEAERMRFLNTMDESKSSQELAGAIRAERDLIPSRFDQLRANITNVLGPEEADKQLARVKSDAQVARINAALAKLDPDGPEAKAMKGQAAPAQPTAPVALPLPQGWSVTVR